MKSRFTWILLLFTVLTFQFSFAQTKVVSGTVTSKDYGDPIPGATIIVEGTTRGVDTDENGRYSIEATQGEKLVVRYLGFRTYKATVGASDVLNIALIEEESEDLTDLVIDVYRTTSKPKSNVAASTVTSKTIEGRPNASFVQTLQAQVPGLNISTGSGQPGSNNTTVILRGIGSINGNVEPLFVIDGVAMGSDNFRSINPNDIENITVLKDAGATSIYGNRGANGVIVVTTKGGSFNQDLTIKYVGTTGVSTLQKNNYNMMNGTELRAFERSVYQQTATAKGRNWSQSQIDNAPNTNWLDHFFKPAVSQSHTLSLTSGSALLSSFTSIGYTEQDGILDNTDLKRFNFRNNLNGKSKDGRLTYGTNLTANYSTSRLASNLGTGGVNQNYVVGALQGLPYISPSDYPGTGQGLFDDYLDTNGSLVLTPLLLMDKMQYFRYNEDEFKMIVQGNINYKLTNNLSVGSSLGVDYTTINQSMYDDPRSFNSILFGPYSTGQDYGGEQRETYQRVFTTNSTTYLKWGNTYGKHDIKAGLYLEYLKAHLKSNSLTQDGLDPMFSSPGGGTGWIPYDGGSLYIPSITGSKLASGLFSYFGSVDYDYDSRFGLGVTVRRDASFRFAESNRWGTFYSISGRWNISNENFMEGSVFNDLKIRGSYGTAGNQDIAGTGLFGASNLYATLYNIGVGYNNDPSLLYTQLPNPDLKWETITQANIGVDFGVWESRLRGTIDVYEKTTKDLYQRNPISAINGATSILANVGSMRNRGIEVLLAGDVIRNDNFKLTLTANGSYNKNEIVKLPNEDGIVWNGTSLTALREGDIFGQYYLVPYLGANPETGNLLFLDRNGNPTERPVDADRRFTNKSQIPVYQGGFGFDADYKGFFLTTQFSYALKSYRFDYDYAGFLDTNDIGIFNKTKDLYDAWTPNNRDTQIPSLMANNTFYENISDRNIRDASYLRLRYITLGYSFPASNLAPIKLKSLRIFAQAENLYTWSKWKGFDAESNRPNDQAQYPTPRTISFGIEVQF